jgi:teichoic acid transport system ATP-binding protein
MSEPALLEPTTGAEATPVPDGPEPTVVVDDVHLNYRIIGKRRRGGKAAAVRRLVLGEQAPGQRTIHAVRGVSFTAYRGEAIGLIGPN